MAHIERRGDRRYRARYRGPDGRERSRTFATRREADAWLASTTTSINTGSYVDPRAGKQTFHDFAIEWAASQDWKDTTRESFPREIARVERVLPKGATLASIDQLAIKRARIALAKQYASRTVALSMTHLLAIMRSAYTAGRIGRDVTVGTRSKRRRSGDEHRVSPGQIPTRAEVAAIWAAAPAKYRAAVALGASGLRIGEVLGLTADRIDIEHQHVTIDRQLQRIGAEMTFTTPKGEKPRTIAVPSAVALELRRHLREHEADGLLFRGGRGAAMQRHYFYRQAWWPALEGAGLARDRYRFHALRHWTASAMLAEGVNPVAVAGHLGDALETLQRVYAHWMRDDRNVPSDALERLLVPQSAASSRPGDAAEA